MRKSGRKNAREELAKENFYKGKIALHHHPMFARLMDHIRIDRTAGNRCPENGWAAVTANGAIHVHPTRLADPEEWTYILAHCALHLGLEHFQEKHPAPEWNTACDCAVAQFLADLKLGRVPADLLHSALPPVRDEVRLFQMLCDRPKDEKMPYYGTAGDQFPDLLYEPLKRDWQGRLPDWKGYLARGLVDAVTSAVNVANGLEPYLGAGTQSRTKAVRAREWFISSFPLLGSLAACFEMIEDPIVCNRMQISVAAVNEVAREIYINPAADLSELECRFVMAHELLHVGLRHLTRRQGRDPFLWNAACDYVINGWLVEMGVGEMPGNGALYDPELKGESAESVYDRIVTDLRRNRKLMSFRGIGIGDMMGEEGDCPLSAPTDLDGFYRRQLGLGLQYHESQGRGLVPAGLVEEIRALGQPPIAWDVELAKWFDNYFAPLEKIRTYARPSRRQAATPDIARPRFVPARGAEDARTFGVVLDTSGSMDRHLLAQALGAIVSYSLARDVPAARVIFCDAVAYDQGYMPIEAIAERVKVRGRGGTVLQPGIDLLERAEDFPKDGPILIITDGYCDKLSVRRDHAFLVPEGHHLPFTPKGKVFYLR